MPDTPAKKTTKKAPAKRPTAKTTAKAASAQTEPDEPDYDDLEPSPTGLLSTRGKVIREALSAAGLPVLPDASDDVWALLAEPFDASEIERKPQPLLRGDTDKGRCVEGSHFCADGHACGGWHARSIHLDYIGHAGITTRLNDVVGPAGWEFEPYTHNDDGTPWMTSALFFGRLTILGVEKWDMAASFTSPQEAYGDCLRRCAMRFGIGTYLWSKSEAAAAKAVGATPQPTEQQQPEVPTTEELLKRLDEAAHSQGIDREQITHKWREQHGSLPVDALATLAPVTLQPLVESIEAYIAAQAALQRPAE